MADISVISPDGGTTELNIKDATARTNIGNLADLTTTAKTNLVAAINEAASSGGGTWGSITGTLSDQTDLQTALDGKQGTLIFDNVPTNGSNNPVKSDGIYDAIADVYGVMGQNGAKNLLENTASTTTTNGLTFTVNSDKSVTVNGTASANTVFAIKVKPDLEEDTDYILSGCPTGGGIAGSGLYNLQYSNDVNGSYIDIGNGIQLRKYNYTTYPNTEVRIIIYSGYTANNLVFKPMITDVRDTDSTYVPYAMTNKELTEVKTGTITVDTNCSLVSTANICAKVGNVKMIMQQVKVPSISAGSWQTLATVGDEMKSLLGKDITFFAYLNTSNIHFDAWLRASTGVIEVRPNSNVSADSYVLIVLTYI